MDKLKKEIASIEKHLCIMLAEDISDMGRSWQIKMNRLAKRYEELTESLAVLLSIDCKTI